MQSDTKANTKVAIGKFYWKQFVTNKHRLQI